MNKKFNGNHKAFARISWLSAAEGGRETIPSGGRYSTAARFENAVEKWPQEAWSLVIEATEELQVSSEAVAKVSFLSPDAPLHLLKAGSRFELYEGRRLVARGEVLQACAELPANPVFDEANAVA